MERPILDNRYMLLEWKTGPYSTLIHGLSLLWPDLDDDDDAQSKMEPSQLFRQAKLCNFHC
ncbi:hypothetical protein ACJIZ3_025670 [Penstemon smallii]|uniref:Uncharacterized protein n=1 Tax=Penstemon smallii TaxID=265156 RepID=A0ABD3TV69_9LAMI